MWEIRDKKKLLKTAISNEKEKKKNREKRNQERGEWERGGKGGTREKREEESHMQTAGCLLDLHAD